MWVLILRHILVVEAFDGTGDAAETFPYSVLHGS